MKSLIITTVFILIIYTTSQIIKIENAALNYLVNLVPVLIPSFMLWRYMPKNYLKFMSLKNINVTYDLSIRLENCSLEKDTFIRVRNNLLDLYKNNTSSRVLNENIGDFICKSIIEVDTTLIEIDYNVSMNELFITSKDKIKYKGFITLSQKLFSKIQSIFTARDLYYDNLLVKLNISFLESDDVECRNPLWQRILTGFNNKVVSFKYKTTRNTFVEISNHSISFTADDIESLNKDIKSELSLFTLWN